MWGLNAQIYGIGSMLPIVLTHLFFFLVPFLLLWLLVHLIRACRLGNNDVEPEEVEMLAEIRAGVEKMNQRVEALETILLDDRAASRKES